jgi:hypothetical protein
MGKEKERESPQATLWKLYIVFRKTDEAEKDSVDRSLD